MARLYVTHTFPDSLPQAGFCVACGSDIHADPRMNFELPDLQATFDKHILNCAGVDPNHYAFALICPACNVPRAISCLREEADGDGRIVNALCLRGRHSWELTAIEKDNLRMQI